MRPEMSVAHGFWMHGSQKSDAGRVTDIGGSGGLARRYWAVVSRQFLWRRGLPTVAKGRTGSDNPARLAAAARALKGLDTDQIIEELMERYRSKSCIEA